MKINDYFLKEVIDATDALPPEEMEELKEFLRDQTEEHFHQVHQSLPEGGDIVGTLALAAQVLALTAFLAGRAQRTFTSGDVLVPMSPDAVSEYIQYLQNR